MTLIQRTVLALRATGMAALPADAAAQQRRVGPSVEASLGAGMGGGVYIPPRGRGHGCRADGAGRHCLVEHVRPERHGTGVGMRVR